MVLFLLLLRLDLQTLMVQLVVVVGLEVLEVVPQVGFHRELVRRVLVLSHLPNLICYHPHLVEVHQLAIELICVAIFKERDIRQEDTYTGR